MKKTIAFFFALTALYSQSKAQTIPEKGTKLSDQAAKDIMRQITPDSSKLLKEYGTAACKCIDSIPLSGKSRDETINAINKCIDNQTFLYQSIAKMSASLMGNDANNKTITININKNSDEYKKYYYQLENWLKDSCTYLNTLIQNDGKEGAKSLPTNPKAIKAYNEGADMLRNDDYANALPYFEQVVKIEPSAAFAWDNLGLCNRKLGNLDKALEAYQKSLALDPTGHTPLQNIAVVYVFKKEYEKAIDAYQQLLAVSPNDPEVFYGIGNIYFNDKNNMEKALDNMCKAYNIYTQQKSPYRVDAQKVIGMIYTKMKADNKEDMFYKILKDNNISINK